MGSMFAGALREETPPVRHTGPEGWWTRDGREGVFEVHDEHGQLRELGSWRSGRPHGPWTAWHPDGRRASERHFQHGMLHGPFFTWHPNGKAKSEGEWLDGRPHRTFTGWWPNGRKAVEGWYERGEPVGLWTWWDEDGIVMRQVEFVD